MSKLILISNPGSASRKYALYDDTNLIANLHFELDEEDVICELKDADGKKRKVDIDIEKLADAATEVSKILDREKFCSDKNPLEAIIIRVVAPGDYFTENHVVDDEFMRQLEIAAERNPVHVPNTMNEIKLLREAFAGIKIVAISDSAFQWQKPDTMKYYSFDINLANQFEIKRYGYHGLSNAFVSRYMREHNILPQKMIVMHLGSGASVSAILNGRAMDTSMGYTPLDGLAMSTRMGTIDAMAAIELKKALAIKDDTEYELYLNKKCGLLGLSGVSDDLREVIKKRDEGYLSAAMAHSIFIYRIQAYIGQMAASLAGADAIVFTGTIGERSEEIRRAVTQKLGYLGFVLDPIRNIQADFKDRHAIISRPESKPIYIVQTDETAQMIYDAEKLI